jgi:putative ABC transport system substrate-binding protein
VKLPNLFGTFFVSSPNIKKHLDSSKHPTRKGKEAGMKSLICVVLSVVALVGVASRTESQQVVQPKRVGLVLSGSSATGASFAAALRDGLQENGWVEGRNISIETRYAEGKPERLGEIAAEFMRLPVDIIVTGGVPAGLALKKATQTIPIVVAVATDPAGTGVVTPGGNVAAFNLFPADSAARQLEVLREVVPALNRLAMVWNGSNPASLRNAGLVREAAQASGIEIISVDIQDLGRLDGAFADLRGSGAQAIFLVEDVQFFVQRKRIGELATASGLPAICPVRDYAEAGCLMAYGANMVDMFRQSASYVDRILKGTKPADLPIGRSTRFELVINARTARAIGMTIPQSILTRANKIIE